MMSGPEKLAAFVATAGRPVRTAELSAAGYNRTFAMRAAAAGLVEQVARGWYVAPGAAPERLRPYLEVALRYPSAAICGGSAAWLFARRAAEPTDIEVSLPREQGWPSGRLPMLKGGRMVRIHSSTTRSNTTEMEIAGHIIRIQMGV